MTTITDKTKSTPPTGSAPRAITDAQLEAATGMLLEQMPDGLMELFDVLCSDYGLSRWKLVCGILLDVYMQGRLSAFTIDPTWNDGTRTKDAICKQCKKTFRPKNIGQPYCTDACGTQAEIAKGTLVPGKLTRVIQEEPNAPDNSLDTANADTLVMLRSTKPSDMGDGGWGDNPA